MKLLAAVLAAALAVLVAVAVLHRPRSIVLSARLVLKNTMSRFLKTSPLLTGLGTRAGVFNSVNKLTAALGKEAKGVQKTLMKNLGSTFEKSVLASVKADMLAMSKEFGKTGIPGGSKMTAKELQQALASRVQATTDKMVLKELMKKPAGVFATEQKIVMQNASGKITDAGKAGKVMTNQEIGDLIAKAGKEIPPKNLLLADGGRFYFENGAWKQVQYPRNAVGELVGQPITAAEKAIWSKGGTDPSAYKNYQALLKNSDNFTLKAVRGQNMENGMFKNMTADELKTFTKSLDSLAATSKYLLKNGGRFVKKKRGVDGGEHIVKKCHYG